jgi:hypothetical protein
VEVDQGLGPQELALGVSGIVGHTSRRLRR